MRRTLRPVDAGLLVVVALVWGLNFVVIRWGLASMPPLVFSALRFAACAIPWVFMVKRPNIGIITILLLGFVLGIGVFGFLFVGIANGMPAGLASVVMQLQVFITVALSALVLKERPAAYRWAAMAIGAAGVALIAHQQSSSGTIAAFLMIVAGALSWGIANILLKRLPPTNMLSVMVWISLVPPIPLLVLAALGSGWPKVGQEMSQIGWHGSVAVLYTALLSTIFGYGVWGAMLQKYEASVVAPFALLVPVFGVTCSWTIYGETYRPEAAIACSLIVAALALSTFGHLLPGRSHFGSFSFLRVK